MEKSKNKDKIKFIGGVGIIANLFLLVIKLIGGLIFKSQGLIADAINSFGDVFSSTATLIGGKISEKPEDEGHEFGHGKAEYVASFLIGLFMLIAGFQTLYKGIITSIKNQSFKTSYLLIAIPLVTIMIKAILYIYVNSINKKENSLIIQANSEDHKNDVLLSFGVLVGIIFGYYGYYFVDGLVAAIISIIIIYTGVKITAGAYDILIDKKANVALSDELEKIIEDIEGVNHIDEIKSKPTGNEHIFIIKISVDPEMTVKESHKIAGRIRSLLRQSEGVYDTVVHINPDIDEV
ncbi:MAG: cation diffusion facilitator family transporter [Clostridia bacterium]|nr:cation diffusion facilitator family transporter [Clostridia bacterium]MDD4375612.1 cation diffusion facilitator family transporter [Clostridia bacterium]